MSIQRMRQSKPTIQILPMIDVVFFLLVFFMLFTTFKTTPAGINVDLPKAATGTEQPPQELVLSVGKAGDVYADGDLISTDRLQRIVRDAVARRPDLLVVVKADRETNWEHIIRVMDNARQVGAFRLAFAVEPLP